MSERSRGLARVRTLVVATLAIVANAVGNLLLTLGVKSEAVLHQISGLALLKTIASPYVIAGILFLLIWLGSRLLLLSWADLSFVAPVTAVGYVAAALIGKVFLHELVTLERWLACALISLGALLVGLTPEQTTVPPHRRQRG